MLAIDPGTTSLGVCLIEPFRTPQVCLLREFDLADYAPTAKGLSCYSKGSVTSSSIGACVARMIHEEAGVFGHVQELPDGTLDDRSMTVVIEKQMNISPENCCVLSAFQTHYVIQGVECCILNPTNLEKHFPLVFSPTKGNRSKRKTAIRKYGKRLLTMEEQRMAPVGISKADSTKKRKRACPSFSVHALDAMFYGIAYCKIAPDIELDICALRIEQNSQLKGDLRQRITCYHKQQIAMATENGKRKRKRVRSVTTKT